MKFGPVPLDEAEGAILAHSTVVGDKRLRKAIRLSSDDIAAFRAVGLKEVIVATLADDDVDENTAAERIAGALHFAGIEARPAATGRVNLHATVSGIFTVDKPLIDAVNTVDPDITVATMPPFAPMVEGQMVATIKIIPFAISEAVLEQVLALARQHEAFRMHAYKPFRVGVVQTVLPSIKDSVLDKTLRVTEARLGRTGSSVSNEIRTPHAAAEVAKAITELAADSDMVLVFGASAMSDPDEDVIPAAIRASGGEVFRSGMPVDPGNLFVLGERAGKPVLGAPGCARSPKENGFDWVLDRIVSGVGVTKEDIAGMGVGGLLMEIPTRPQPREPAPVPLHPEIHVVLLAAGRSSRMGGPNKLLALFEGKPLVRRTAERALASTAAGTVVVTGHQSTRVREALSGLAVSMADNPGFEIGLASSLKAGVAVLPQQAAGALVVLGDMPDVSSADLDLLIEAFRKSGGLAVVRAAHQGHRGNPVILPRSLFPAVAKLEGDTGARHLVEAEGLDVVDVEIGAGAAVDVDTPEALARAGGVPQG
ncbi:NTP transferase domain-containing protein [Manganibacter manganicus]|uniref:4-diphosphocytidyl-2C-methyl-D-erythritol kinase n=1 Tax=Manganibacter manganicus TaxID=1873176 RepID=A0A1V8RTU9_9HYPH|nr:molybdopterin-binding/glycosyltransferase family 2 protein [Pseudaminobacter manganicus]OQM76621.1 4-diphosphocytidyl-2C-methyl-D-erythritol kinase [Pseudaminobacter manganicus]